MTTNVKVLVVDDEPQVLIALEDLLSDEFFILKADSAEEARHILAREPDIAVLLTDQRMPRVTGDELLAGLEGHCDASRILLTGYADLGAVVRAVNAGRLFAYVTKPWDPSDLMVKVANAASHFRLSRRLEHEQRLLHDLMDNSPDGIYFKDNLGQFQRVNRAFARIAGISIPEGIVGMTTLDLFPGLENASEWMDEDRKVLEQGKPSLDSMRQYPGSREPRWISETVAPIVAGSGGTLGLVGIARNVTERVHAEEERRAGELRFREQSELLESILNGMQDGVVFADPYGTLVYFNRHVLSLLPQAESKIQVESWAKEYGFVHPESKAPLLASEDPFARAIHQRVASEVEVLVTNTPGTARLLVISAAPVSGSLGATVGTVALIRDVTEQRRLELQVAQSEKMEAIGRLAGGVAHDFNNLLGVIQGYGELVLQTLRASDPIREDIEEMMRTTNRAAALTRRLLEFSRQQAVQRRVISLNQVITGMEEMIRRVLGELIEIRFSLAGDLGPIRADASQLEQIVLNLVINARDAMPSGGTLCLNTYHPDDSEVVRVGLVQTSLVAFSVSDTGSGIDEETKVRIFEPFFTTKPIGRGTGLGLSTVYSIVQQSAGQIRVDSEPGIGTTFTVYFPLISAPEDNPTPLPSVQRNPMARAKILLVEDDAALKTVLARVLRKQGHTVIEADSSAHALLLVSELVTPIDLLLTDVVMPGMSGAGLARVLREQNTALRVLYFSGYGKSSLPAEDLLPGKSVCLEKPFSPSSLLQVVGELLQEVEGG